MGKKRGNHAKMAAAAAAALESKTKPILELKYDDPIFTMAAHPTKNLIATGLATGHVIVQSYDHEQLENVAAQKRKEAKSKISSSTDEKKVSKTIWTKYNADEIDDESLVNVVWKTKRHKGSCRSIAFDSTGETLYSVGTDKIIKKAQAESGKVILKTPTIDMNQNFTKLVVAPNKPTLVVGSEAGHIYVYDTRTMKEVHKVLNAHDDAVNSITNMSALSDYQYISVGSTTLTHFDIRKGIIQQSEDQEDEMLSVCFVDPSNCETAIAGMGEGVVTMWKKSKNDFVDQISRVRVGKDSVDAVISSLEHEGDFIWAGSADGVVSKVDTRRGKVIETRLHHSDDEISGLDIDFDYRLITVGMERLKIWSNETVNSSDEESSDEDDYDLASSDDDEDGTESSDNESINNNDISNLDSDSENDDDETLPKLREKKSPLLSAISRSKKTQDEKSTTQISVQKLKQEQKRAVTDDKDDEDINGKTSSKRKQKKMKLTGKQLKNMQSHEHGIKRFEDL